MFKVVVMLCCAAVARGEDGEVDCVYKHRAQLVALLALHSGNNCNLVVERGLQQEAALTLVNRHINSQHPERPQVDIKVYDTCSKSDRAVNAVLQTLVRANQGCHAPFFLGFIGPEEADSLQAAAKVNSVFDFPHAALQAVPSYTQYNTFEVETVYPSKIADGISILLDEMNWSSFYMVFTDDETTSQVARNVLENTKYCVLGRSMPVSALNETNHADVVASYERLLNVLQTGGNNRLLIMAEKPDSAKSLLSHLEAVTNTTDIIIYLRHTGFLPWTPSTESRNIFLLQETSKLDVFPGSLQKEVEKSPLWPKFVNQTNCTSMCSERLIRDSTTTNLAFAVHLFHDALRQTLSQTCSNPEEICPKMLERLNWKNNVEWHTYQAHDQPIKMHFHSIFPRQIDIFSVNEYDFQKIGGLTNDELVLSERLPYADERKDEQCGVEGLLVLPTASAPADRATPARPTGLPIVVHMMGMQVRIGDFGYYDLVALLTGLAFAMVILIVLMICLVYRCFRVKVDSTFSSSSTPSRATPKKKIFQISRGLVRNNSIHTVIE